MSIRIKEKLAVLSIAAGFALSPFSAKSADIVDTAVEAGQFSTLAAAIEAAGLVDVLKGDGPFTVYAPTDAAFAALPEGTLESLLLPENKDQLTNILLYHVDDRNLTANQIPVGSNYFKPVLETARLCITANANGVSIADGSNAAANVIAADVMADNGVIHVIDKVLIPGDRPACH